MPTFRQKTDAGDQGFTLLEMIVVIAILAMATLAAPVLYTQLVPSFQLRQHAYDIAYVARALREEARLQSKTTGLVVDEAKNSVRATGSATKVPVVDISGEVTVAYAPAFEDMEVTTGTIYFYPTGASTGGTITLSRGNLDVAIKVDWVSGAVEVKQ